MYKMCVVLGWPVIRMQLLNTYQVEEYLDMISKIRQHRMITSDSLDKYYSEKANAEGLLESYQEFMYELLGSDSYIEIKDTYEDLSQNISWYLKKKNREFAIAIGIERDFILPYISCKYQYSIKEASEDENGPFAMYSVKANFFRKKDESVMDCFTWLQNQFKYEKEVNLIDPYIIDKENDYDCLKKYIIPLIRSDCKINIHTVVNAVYKQDILDYAKKIKIDIKIYEYSEMHNRYITTSDRVIGIQLGLFFMKEKRGNIVFRKSCDFVMKKKDTSKIYLEVERDLAGKSDIE